MLNTLVCKTYTHSVALVQTALLQGTTFLTSHI